MKKFTFLHRARTAEVYLTPTVETMVGGKIVKKVGEKAGFENHLFETTEERIAELIRDRADFKKGWIVETTEASEKARIATEKATAERTAAAELEAEAEAAKQEELMEAAAERVMAKKARKDREAEVIGLLAPYPVEPEAGDSLEVLEEKLAAAQEKEKGDEALRVKAAADKEKAAAIKPKAPAKAKVAPKAPAVKAPEAPKAEEVKAPEVKPEEVKTPVEVKAPEAPAA